MTARTFNPKRHCGAEGKQGGGACRHPKGFRTGHLGAGNCYLHGGLSPNGKKHAATEQAAQALVKLGVPLGDGDPIKLLGDSVRHAQGLLEASSQAVLGALEPDDGTARPLVLTAALELYLRSLKEAHRTAKASVDANIAERMARLTEEQARGVLRALQAGLDVAGVHGDMRAAAEAAVIQALAVRPPVGAELN